MKGSIKKPLLYTTFSLVVTVQDFLKQGEMLESWSFLHVAVTSPTPCVMFSVNVQITQPYCPCCQFLSPFPDSFLPTYLPATSLPACFFYHLLCHFYMHVVLMGVNVFTSGRAQSSITAVWCIMWSHFV